MTGQTSGSNRAGLVGAVADAKPAANRDSGLYSKRSCTVTKIAVFLSLLVFLSVSMRTARAEEPVTRRWESRDTRRLILYPVSAFQKHVVELGLGAAGLRVPVVAPAN